MGQIFTQIASILTGGAISTIAETVKEYFPPSMSDQEKAELSLKIADAENKKSIAMLELINRETEEFNKRIIDLEGTAKDIKSIPINGSILIFLRGAQRPVWGFSTLYMGYMALSGNWDIANEPRLQAMLVAINLLVLGFLFGERAVKNIAPLIKEFFGRK